MREQLGERLPAFSDAELALLGESDTDFYGMNYYTSQFARHRDGRAADTDFLGNMDELQQNKQGAQVGEKSGLPWLRSCPDLFRKHLTRVHGRYGKPIYVTENGCPCPGEENMTRDEAVHDAFRIRYFRSHLDSICKSIGEDGAVVKGYFAWALLDNLGEYSKTLESNLRRKEGRRRRKKKKVRKAKRFAYQNGLMGTDHGSVSRLRITRRWKGPRSSRRCCWDTCLRKELNFVRDAGVFFFSMRDSHVQHGMANCYLRPPGRHVGLKKQGFLFPRDCK